MHIYLCMYREREKTIVMCLYIYRYKYVTYLYVHISYGERDIHHHVFLNCMCTQDFKAAKYDIAER